MAKTIMPDYSGRPVDRIEEETRGQLAARFESKILEAAVVRPRVVRIVIDRANLFEVASYLKEALGFEHLSCITAVDWKDRYDCVYHVTNWHNGCIVQITARIPYNDPRIQSLVKVWNAANYHERESWDLMGIVFEGHPRLERILLPKDFKFHPLRKDFAQEVDRQYISRRKLKGGK